MADFAAASDVAALRPLTDVEAARTTLLLSYASLLIRQQVPDVDARVTAGTLPPQIPQLVAVQMVLRGLQQLAATPGAKSESTTTGPLTHSVTYAEAVGSGLLAISEGELGMLQSAGTPSTSAGVGTIRLTPGFGGLGGFGW